MSNPRFLIQQIIKSGMNEREIADELRLSGVDVSVPTLNRIKNGRVKRTGFDIGLALLRLHERRVEKAARDHAA